MLIMTTHITKKKILGVIFAAFALVCIVCFYANNSESATVFEKSGVTVKNGALDSEEGRMAFLKELGWEAETQEFMEVQVPYEFDEVYEKYNEIQKNQGMNLEKYRGKRAMRYTYKITNYPGSNEEICAHLLVYKGKLIAGDICSEKENGFMHGLEMK